METRDPRLARPGEPGGSTATPPTGGTAYPGRFLGSEPLEPERRGRSLEELLGAGPVATGTAARPVAGTPVAGSAEPAAWGEWDDEEEGLRTRAGRALRRATRAGAIRLVWLAVASAIAFGSAGIVSAAQHSPASGNRPELYYGADQAFQPTIDAATARLQRLASEVDALGETARLARSSLTQENRVKLQDAVNTGSQDLDLIDTDAKGIRSLLLCDAGVGRLTTTNSPATIARVARICSSLDATAPLGEDWAILAQGSLQAMDMRDQILKHDQIAGEALQLATKGDYVGAITKLSSATKILSDARTIYDHLSKATDVWTLGQWVDRSQAMDDALRQLWQAMIDSKGRVTAAVTDALRAVASAKSLLPPDTKYMSIVLAEMASGGLNQAAISIETARGRLAAAVQGLSAP